MVNSILILFYSLFLYSPISQLYKVSLFLLMFNLLCTFSNLSQANIKQLKRTRKIAQRITRSDLKHILLKTHNISRDLTHPLHICLCYNQSGVHLCVPKTIRCHFRLSFIPNAIHILNRNSKRYIIVGLPA